MNRLAGTGLLLLLIGLLGCGRNAPGPVAVVPTRDTEETPNAPAASAGAPIVAPQTRTADEAAIRRSPLGAALIKEGYGIIPLMQDRKTSKLYVNCLANGKPLCLNVDTGFTNSCVSQEAAKSVGLVTQDSPLVIVAVGSEVHPTKSTRIDELIFCESLKMSLDVSVADFSALRELSKRRGNVLLDGVIGAAWLAQYSCIIDFDQSCLFYLDPAKKGRNGSKTGGVQADPGSTPKSVDPKLPARADNEADVKGSTLGTALLREGYSYAKLVRSKSSDLYLNCLVDGKRTCLVVDTGADGMSLSDETARGRRLTLRDSTYPFAGLGSKPLSPKVVDIADFRFGTVDTAWLQGVSVVDLAALREHAKQNADVALDGILGANLLGLYACVIDYSHDVLYYVIPGVRGALRYAASFNGEWQAAKVCRFGNDEPADRAKDWRLSFGAKQNELRNGKDVWECQFVSHLQNYRTINVMASATSVPDRGKVFFGICEFDESRKKLTLCLSTDGVEANRPTRMESPKGSQIILIEFERVPAK